MNFLGSKNPHDRSSRKRCAVPQPMDSGPSEALGNVMIRDPEYRGMRGGRREGAGAPDIKDLVESGL